jgi:hypothetical protein
VNVGHSAIANFVRHGENSSMSKKPMTHWTIDELNKVVAQKFQAAKKYQPGPQRQKLVREAKRYQSLLETKKSISIGLQPPNATSVPATPSGA